MKTLTFALACAVASVSFAQTVRAPQHVGGPGVDAEYDQYYNASNEITISGTVVGKVKGTPTDGKSESESILVKNSRGHVYSVDLGPSWFIRPQVAKVNMGDYVKVTGSSITFQNRETVLLAKNVVDHKHVLAIRDDNGNPYWMAFLQGAYGPNTLPGVNNPQYTSRTGTIVSMKPVTVNNQQLQGMQLQTDDGSLVNVAVAPQWYMEAAGIGFHVGNNATVYYGPGPVRFGPAIIASGSYVPNSYVAPSFVPVTVVPPPNP